MTITRLFLICVLSLPVVSASADNSAQANRLLEDPSTGTTMDLFSLPLSSLDNALAWLLASLLTVFVIVMLTKDPKRIPSLLGLCKKNEVLKFLGIGMGGVLLALEVSTMRDAAEQQAKATRELATANQNTEQGQRQQRMNNAIEHLGNPDSDSVRLGGAYELFHLAQDVPQLNRTVLDILCAHIRSTTGKDEYREQHKSAPSEEVQSLLTLLVVREHEAFKGLRVNLQGSWLRGASLGDAQLQGADLADAQLQGAYLAEAQLQGAYLVDAQLQRAHLSNAQLQRAHLSDAQLQGAGLAEAQLQGAYLRGAQLQGAYLGDAQLQGAYLANAQLQGVATRMPVEPDSAKRIEASIGKETDLSGSTLQGGLERETLDSLVEGLSDKDAKALRKRLEPHIGQPASNQLPKDSRAVTGAYTEEEAKQWIADYEEATSKASGVNGS